MQCRDHCCSKSDIGRRRCCYFVLLDVSAKLRQDVCVESEMRLSSLIGGSTSNIAVHIPVVYSGYSRTSNSEKKSRRDDRRCK